MNKCETSSAILTPLVPLKQAAQMGGELFARRTCVPAAVIPGAGVFHSSFSVWLRQRLFHGRRAKSFVRDIQTFLLPAATKALFVTFSDRPPPRAVLLPPPPRPPRPPRGPPRPRPGRPRSPKLMSSWDVMSLAGLRKWWSADSSPVWRREG